MAKWQVIECHWAVNGEPYIFWAIYNQSDGQYLEKPSGLIWQFPNRQAAQSAFERMPWKKSTSVTS